MSEPFWEYEGKIFPSLFQGTQIVKRLVEALKLHAKDEIVVADVFRALINLSVNSKKNKRRLVIVCYHTCSLSKQY